MFVVAGYSYPAQNGNSFDSSQISISGPCLICVLLNAFINFIGMFYYQMPSYYNAPAQHHPYRQAMFVHYAEPSYPGYPQYQGRASETNGVTAFAAGDTIAAGSYSNGLYS